MLYRNFLLNSSLKAKISLDKDYLLNKLDSIDSNHFKILKYYLDKKYNSSSSVGSQYDGRKEELNNLVSPNFYVYEVDLCNIGFLKQVPNPPGSEMRYYLSDLGKEFLNFIKYDIN